MYMYRVTSACVMKLGPLLPPPPPPVALRDEMRECIFNKGQSKRIWNELFKVQCTTYLYMHIYTDYRFLGAPLTSQVIDSSDVVIQVSCERGREGGRQAGRQAGRQGGKEGGREGGREGGMDGWREGRVGGGGDRE